MDNQLQQKEKVVDSLRLRRHTLLQNKNAGEGKVEKEEMEQIGGRNERHNVRGGAPKVR